MIQGGSLGFADSPAAHGIYMDKLLNLSLTQFPHE